MDERAARLLGEIGQLADGPVRIMEVCGTHTVSVFRSGLRRALPPQVQLVSGPGCPVCVTPRGEIDRALEACRRGAILATFGDLMRVPGSRSSLLEERARGADVRVVVSPLDALSVAQAEPGRPVVLFGVGFETTAPAIALTVREARRRGLRNFLLLSAQRLIPPAIRALLSGGRARIDGFLLPGHVSVIIGQEPYRFIAEEFGLPGVITGFEPLDVLEGIRMLLRQRREGRAQIEIQYRRAVRPEGNPRAQRAMAEAFRVTEARWRGLGLIPASGLELDERWAEMEAARALGLPLEDPPDPPGCRCGEVLQGAIAPPECPLFARRCTPDSPLGPCMVSSEGACGAYYRYGGWSDA